jgi:Fur family ferric uptake transcriptional regulator
MAAKKRVSESAAKSPVGLDDVARLSAAELIGLRGALREGGLRVTQPRMMVLAELFQAAGPMSHAEVATRLAKQGLDRVTVWRNLVALTDAGLLARTDVGDHTWRFEKAEGGGGHDNTAHAHFVCVACKKVSCLPAVSLSGTARGSVVLEVQVKGRCDACVDE